MKRNLFALGKIRYDDDDNMNVNIGGASHNIKAVPSNYNYAEGADVLVLFLDDDVPVIMGRPGWSTPYE